MKNKNYLAIFAKSFNWAGFFLPKKIYEDCAKLYAFCRVLDDIADEESNLNSKIERFDKIKNFFKDTYDPNNEHISSSNENETIINDVVGLAERKKIKRIILYGKSKKKFFFKNKISIVSKKSLENSSEK